MNLEAPLKLDRRRFITYLVAAPTLTFLTRFAGSPRVAEAAASADGNFVQMILEVTRDNKIIMQVERAEVGQGIATGFAMLVAEELDAKLDDIDVRLADTGFVGGSNSIRSGWSRVRSTAATARAYRRDRRDPDDGRRRGGHHDPDRRCHQRENLPPRSEGQGRAGKKRPLGSGADDRFFRLGGPRRACLARSRGASAGHGRGPVRRGRLPVHPRE